MAKAESILHDDVSFKFVSGHYYHVICCGWTLDHDKHLRYILLPIVAEANLSGKCVFGKLQPLCIYNVWRMYRCGPFLPLTTLQNKHIMVCVSRFFGDEIAVFLVTSSLPFVTSKSDSNLDNRIRRRYYWRKTEADWE